MEPELYRIKEFCQKYVISRRSLYREIEAERIQVIRRGRRVLIARAEAERWFRCLGHYKTPETMQKRYAGLVKSTWSTLPVWTIVSR